MRGAEVAVPGAGDEDLGGGTQSGLRSNGGELLQGAAKKTETKRSLFVVRKIPFWGST